MKTTLHHLQLNVGDAGAALPFWRALLGYLEYRVIAEAYDFLGMTDGGTDFWVIATPAERRAGGFHRKNVGLNHVAFRVGSRRAVDTFHQDFLQVRRITPLYGGPREYPEYAPGYYAVFFEDPDRLKVEVVHIPSDGAL
jgi:catechol 2,3-dioxygenase-like lactoylglutathione lyase family enzyme